MRVLLVEDDATTATFIVKSLRQSGYAVDHCADGEAGLRFALGSSYDAAVVDVMLPKLDGLSLVKQLRDQKQRVPVIILSAKSQLEDRIEGLELGCDDYLTKPFAMVELLARLHALIRRASHPADAGALSVADLTMDLLRREVARGAQKIELQRREFALLEYLLRSQGRVVTKMMILEHVWDFNFDPRTNVVDVLIYRLRQKIDKGFQPKLIQTIRGSGYALRVPPGYSPSE